MAGNTQGSATTPNAAALDVPRRALGRALGETPSIVIKAASIIEEEVAIGIGAAKRIEQRLLDVEALRGQPADAVMSRFRRDAHEAVDIILDLITVAAAAAEGQPGRFINITASRRMAGAGASEAPRTGSARTPTVHVPGVIPPGGTGEVAMALENESERSTVEFTLHTSELVSASGARIPGECVRFEPATLAVGPRTAGRVAVRVDVPMGTESGTYEGLVRATQLDELRAVLAVTVGAA